MLVDEVLDECYRVLSPGGQLVIPSFPSYLSRNGLHLKKRSGCSMGKLVLFRENNYRGSEKKL